ncbi:MAG: PKD domain-containing protein [Blastocatellales bacterium]
MQQKLIASDGIDRGNFGGAVAIDGDTLVIGASGYNSNAAYVFVRSGTAWTEQQKLVPSDGVSGDNFGDSVAINGDTIVVGAWSDDIGANINQGSAYVFVRSGSTWFQQQKLTASDAIAQEEFGHSVAISGDTIVIGNTYNQIGSNFYQGSAYVYLRTGTIWAEQQKLIATDGAAGDNFGNSVAISGDTIVVGALGDDIGSNINQGSAYVFTRSGSAWFEDQKLTASDGAGAGFGTGGDHFGSAVTINRDTIVIGSPDDNTAQGSAHVFIRSGTIWSEHQKLTASDGAGEGNYLGFGYSLAIREDIIVVGPYDDDIGSNTNQGSAYVFARSGTVWSEQQKLIISDGARGDSFGRSISISGDTLVAGSPGEDIVINENQGSAYVYMLGANQSPDVTITMPLSGAIFAVGTPVSFAGSFTDDSVGMHTAIWMFDSITVSGLVNEITREVTATHIFTTAGVYLVKLSVNDCCGGTGEANTVDGLTAMVVVYDPNGGFVTGGGWIDSPAGAYVPNPDLTGKANFGFVSKYQNGQSVPTGNTEFHFKAGDLKFKSTSYEWMVISGGKKAQYKGFGTINGGGNYRFMLTAIDGDQPGGGGQDKFRIRIWSDAGGLVYDNQMNAPDSNDPTTVLGGGSIVIHKP